MPHMRNKPNKKKTNKIIIITWLLTIKIKSNSKEENETMCYCIKQIVDIIMKPKQKKKSSKNCDNNIERDKKNWFFNQTNTTA